MNEFDTSGGVELDVASILHGNTDELPAGHRAGMVALVGRPNVGKSTLMNALVGEKVAIVTKVPGTTRNQIRGVVTREDAQVVFLDTPGMAKPQTLLAQRLNKVLHDTWSGVDLVCFLVDGIKGVQGGDKLLAQELASTGTPVVVIVTKEDRFKNKEQAIPVLLAVQELGTWPDIVPVSAESGFNLDVLLDVIVRHLPEGPRLFRTGEVSDQPMTQRAAELLREKLIRRMEGEVPHSIMVVVEEIEFEEHETGDGLTRLRAEVHVERDSQKGIVIGKGGEVLRDAGTEARKELEVLFGTKVHLETHVTVSKNWQKDPKALGKFGY